MQQAAIPTLINRYVGITGGILPIHCSTGTGTGTGTADGATGGTVLLIASFLPPFSNDGLRSDTDHRHIVVPSQAMCARHHPVAPDPGSDICRTMATACPRRECRDTGMAKACATRFVDRTAIGSGGPGAWDHFDTPLPPTPSRRCGCF